ncbi:hypothetical protein, partial [Akkermansia massiliensis]
LLFVFVWVLFLGVGVVICSLSCVGGVFPRKGGFQVFYGFSHRGIIYNNSKKMQLKKSSKGRKNVNSSFCGITGIRYTMSH